MFEQYNALPQYPLESGISYHRPPQDMPDHVTADSPAIDVMTDFRRVAAMTMGPCATLEAANQRMISTGVRLLLVTDQYNAVIGVITATDILSEKPMRYLQEVGGRREDILLRDIMTPQEQIEAMDMQQVERATVGDIARTLMRVGRQHALVVERDGHGNSAIRGLFSTKQIGRQLGFHLEPTEVANSFAEVGAALAS